jgi:heme/copper-type cytochrome/quinol oxidase subunit 3
MSAAPVAESRRFGMWVFLVTDAMGFGAFLLAYAVLRARADGWPDVAARLNLPLAVVATVVLLASSVTLSRGWIWPTIALGAAFLGAQAWEYTALAHHGVGFGHDQAASIFFAATGWHGLHVLVGIVVLALARRGPAQGAAALFWQFVDAVWIVLFVSFYLGPAVPAAAAVALGVAAAAGFAAIVFFAMNLRGEGRAVRVIFVLPLALPVGYTVALVADAIHKGIRP